LIEDEIDIQIDSIKCTLDKYKEEFKKELNSLKDYLFEYN